jgi:protein-tyrosine-phosphatase
VDDELTVLREGAIPEVRLANPDQATILFVCQGNTDRSPLAAAILRRRLARHLGIELEKLEEAGFRVLSAGTSAKADRPASIMVRRIARSWPDGPLDLESHRSQALSSQLLEESTRIFCMEREHREQILAFYPHRERDVMLVDPEGGDIADPAGATLEAYLRLARRLDAAATLIALSLARRPS